MKSKNTVSHSAQVTQTELLRICCNWNSNHSWSLGILCFIAFHKHQNKHNRAVLHTPHFPLRTDVSSQLAKPPLTNITPKKHQIFNLNSEWGLHHNKHGTWTTHSTNDWWRNFQVHVSFSQEFFFHWNNNNSVFFFSRFNEQYNPNEVSSSSYLFKSFCFPIRKEKKNPFLYHIHYWNLANSFCWTLQQNVK